MRNWHEELDDFDEIPDENLEDDMVEDMLLKGMEIPPVDWKDDIEKIEDQEIREKEIEAAEKIHFLSFYHFLSIS